MKTTENLNDETDNRSIKPFLAVKGAKRLLAVSAGTLLTVGMLLSANAQQGTVYSVNIVGFRDVADKTVQLLTSPMTPTQRQARHAQNFNQLALSHRGLYLFAVAYGVSCLLHTDGPTTLSAAALAEELATVPSIYDAPAVAQEHSQIVAAHLAIVNAALQELNVAISDQIANNSDFTAWGTGGIGGVANNSDLQQAMFAGAVHGRYFNAGDTISIQFIAASDANNQGR